jgi:hypothetical protein
MSHAERGRTARRNRRLAKVPLGSGSCECKKRRYIYRSEAKAALKGLRERTERVDHLGVYRCPEGTGFHIGHGTAQLREWYRDRAS